MEINLDPGTYVVAVSGGVDSMAMLHLLSIVSYQPSTKLVVAHFEHGIRGDSDLDRQLVQQTTERYGLPFVYDRGMLGPNASEAQARKARYAFLNRVRQASGADAIITAHHQDDLLETAVHNMLRGTGRRGLVSLRSREHILRPLLGTPKADIVTYAKDQGLTWHEDSTNADTRYRRNHIRHTLLPKMTKAQKAQILEHIRTVHRLDAELETELINHLHIHPGISQLDRHGFIMLPHAVAREVLVTWLRRHGVQDISSKTLERLLVAAKTYTRGRQADVDKRYVLLVGKDTLTLNPREC